MGRWETKQWQSWIEFLKNKIESPAPNPKPDTRQTHIGKAEPAAKMSGKWISTWELSQHPNRPGQPMGPPHNWETEGLLFGHTDIRVLSQGYAYSLHSPPCPLISVCAAPVIYLGFISGWPNESCDMETLGNWTLPETFSSILAERNLDFHDDVFSQREGKWQLVKDCSRILPDTQRTFVCRSGYMVRFFR